jgi:hypothetical protein
MHEVRGPRGRVHANDRPQAAGTGPMSDNTDIIQDLYASEINARLEWF